ncbi:MAG TPA: DUF4349 domain-containing protein [Egibacteraceae bacterium]|nr:DUF4349 domain-containing protein [Egibacteraceae bacterium]
MRRSHAIWVVLALLLAGCSGQAAIQESDTAEPAAEPVAPGDLAGAEDAAAPADEDISADRAEGGGSSGLTPEGLPLPDVPQTVTGDRIIKEGSVSIEVGEGDFDASYARVIEAARRLGGQVVASSSVTSDEGGTTGSVTVRVPVDRFEDLLIGVGSVGEISSREISAQDVSSEYVDLGSRKRHLQAQEAFYLELLGRAAGVSDAIAVQQQLDGIQSQIEQIQGRLNWLAERSAYSTLTVHLLEPGAALPQTTDPAQRPSLARYWSAAQDGFVNVVGVMLFISVLLAPILIPVGLAVLLWTMARRRQRVGAAAVPAE